MINLQLDGAHVVASVVGIVSALVYFAAIAFVIVFIVKSVKYFVRQEKILREISAKLDKINDGDKTE